MITLVWAEDSPTLVPDAQAMAFAEQIAGEYSESPCNLVVRICQAIVFDAFRVQILQGRLSHRDLALSAGGLIYELDKNAGMQRWPRELDDHANILEYILVGHNQEAPK